LYACYIFTSTLDYIVEYRKNKHKLTQKINTKHPKTEHKLSPFARSHQFHQNTHHPLNQSRKPSKTTRTNISAISPQSPPKPMSLTQRSPTGGRPRGANSSSRALHQIFLMSSAGMLLYYREFQNIGTTLKPDFIGAILVATVDFTTQRTGTSLAYVQLSEIGIAVAHSAQCRCIVTVDRDEGSASFARLLANELLDAFQTRYLRDTSLAVFSSDQFSGFSSELYDIARHCVRPVLDYLAYLPGVHLALITGGNSNLFYSTKDIDKIGVVASLPRLIEKANDLFDNDYETMTAMRLTNNDSSVHIFRLERSTLIIVTRDEAKLKQYSSHIEHSIQVLRKVLAVSNFLSG